MRHNNIDERHVADAKMQAADELEEAARELGYENPAEMKAAEREESLQRKDYYESKGLK